MKKYLFVFFVFLLFNASLFANVINVADFGAIPNDDNDDTQAIITALAACNRNGATLNFMAGNYLIQGDQTGTPIFSIWGYQNLTINGNNATLSCKNWNVVFYAANSSRLNINGFTITWERDLPFSYGTITAKGTGYIDVTLADSQLARAGLKSEAILEYDPVNMRPATNGFDFYQYNSPLTQIISSNVIRCFSDFYYNIGTHVVIRHQIYEDNVFLFVQVNGLSLSNIVVYSGGGMCLYGSANTNVSINNFQVKRFGTRWMSTCADGIHLSATRGTINIENSYLQGMGDDGFNIHGKYFQIESISGNSLCIRDAYTNHIPYSDDIPLKGDTMVFLDPATMVIKGEAVVVATSANNSSDCQSVTLNALASGVVSGDQLYNKSAVASLNVINTQVVGNRARGMLLQTSNAHITNCTFNQCSAPAILVTASTGGMFIESSPPKHVTISGCNFINCNYGTISMNAPLMLFTNTSTNQFASDVINDIHINNNSFTTIADQPGIMIHSSGDVSLDSNQFSNKTAQQIDYIYNDNDYCSVYVNRKSNTNSKAYGGTPVKLPAKIEAENFDTGGEGVAYHDVTVQNQGESNYRSGERVDVYDDGTGGHGINYAVCGEWLGYTVTVPQNGFYNLIVRGSTAFDWSTFHIEKNFKNITPLSIFPNTGGWSNFQNDTVKSVYMEKGTYQIKFVWDNLGITLDQFTFTQSGVGPVLNISTNQLTIGASINSTQSFDVISNVNWKVAADKTWLSVDPVNGSGIAPVTVTAKENPATSAKTATVTISGTGVTSKTIAITQNGGSPVLKLSANTLTIAASANSTKTFDIISNIGWSVQSNQTWLTANKTTGSYNSTITLTAAKNSVAATRSATITVSGTGVTSQTITVIQDAGATGYIENENSTISIFPNPVTTILFIYGSTPNTKVSIYDTGNKILECKLIDDNKIDVSNLKNGFYIIKIETKNGVVSRKFEKKQ
jgi:hypothetical protein